MHPLRGLHSAALRAHPRRRRGRAVSRCCRKPRLRVQLPRCATFAAAAVLRALPAAHSAAAAARARHWRARALPGFAGADRAARRAGRGSPPAVPRLHKPPQGLRARSGPRPSQARYARPCRALPPWCGAAAAGCPQPRPGSGRRAPCRAPSSPGFARAPCTFGAAARPAAPGLPCGYRRPKSAAAGRRSRRSPHPPPAP